MSLNVEERRKELLSLLSIHQHDSSKNDIGENKQSYTVYQSNTYAQLYDKNQMVWAYINNEYHRCKIIKLLQSNSNYHNDTDDEFDENEATPPINNESMDNMSNCSTPPITTQFDQDCNTPEPPISDIKDEMNNNGLCDSSMPIYLILCLTPRYKCDKPCKQMMENNQCQFYQNNKCQFSHGLITSLCLFHFG